MKEGNATALSLALLLLLAVLTPPAPFSVRGLLQVYAFNPEPIMPKPEPPMAKPDMEDACVVSGNGSGMCSLPTSASSSLTNEPLMSEALQEGPVTPDRGRQGHATKGHMEKEPMTFEEARQQFSPRVELKSEKADSMKNLSLLSSFNTTPATRRLLIGVGASAGISLLLTMMVVGTFMCGALGVIGLMVTMLACGLVMCVLTCAFFSFCWGLGISILVGVSVAAAMLSFQLCMRSLDGVQSMVARHACGS